MNADRGTPIGGDCRLFRSVLERTLRDGSAGLAPLQWHEHLLGCEPCSELLRSEEALEMLLSSLPDPQLPPHLAQRVLMRLDASRLDLGLTSASPGLPGDLDGLLDLDRELSAPAGLSARVLSGVRGAAQLEEARLDALLDRAGSVDVPVGLSGRVLASLEAERGIVLPGSSGPASIHSFFTARRALFAAAAAGLALWVGSTLIFPSGRNSGDKTLQEQLAGLDTPDPALLDDLDVLQQYELLMDPDPDLVFASELDATTEVMLDLTEEL